VIESTQYGANGVVLNKSTNTYTSSGGLNIVEREIRYPNGALQSKEFHDIPNLHVEIILYKPKGTVLSRSVRDGDLIRDYSEDRSLNRSTSISDLSFPRNSAAVDSNSTPQIGQSTDQIDSQGNWTKRTDWVTLPNGTKLVKVTYRTITYYGE